MSLYRNGEVVKFGMTEFCAYFDSDVKIEYHKDSDGNEYFYSLTGRNDVEPKRVIRFKRPEELVEIFNDLYEDTVVKDLYEYSFDEIYDSTSDESFYEQALNWIKDYQYELRDTLTEGVICAIINPKVLYDDFKATPRFIRFHKGAYARVNDACYTIEQAFYLANKRWNETKDKSVWKEFYVRCGDAILKDFVKEANDNPEPFEGRGLDALIPQKYMEAEVTETPRERILREYGIDISTPPKHDGVGISAIIPATSEEMNRHTYDGYQKFLMANNID